MRWASGPLDCPVSLNALFIRVPGARTELPWKGQRESEATGRHSCVAVGSGDICLSQCPATHIDQQKFNEAELEVSQASENMAAL